MVDTALTYYFIALVSMNLVIVSAISCDFLRLGIEVCLFCHHSAFLSPSPVSFSFQSVWVLISKCPDRNGKPVFNDKSMGI